MERKLETLKREVKNFGLVGKPVKDLLDVANSLYYRIHRYAKSHKLWLAEVFFDLGFSINKVNCLDSVERLDIFMGKMFSYKNKDWSEMDPGHKLLIKDLLKSLDISFDLFLLRYGLSNKGNRAYNSISDLKRDLNSKGLSNATIGGISMFDQGKTIANIESFATNSNLKMKDVWFILGIPYAEGIVTCETGVKKDFVYHTDDEMIQDFKEKKLLGRTKKEVKNYDNGKTFGRVVKYGKRQDLNIQTLWNILEVKSSPKKRLELACSSLNELKKLVEKRGLQGKSISEVNNIDLDITALVKKFARNGTPMADIWKYVGIVRSQGFSSIDQIAHEITKAGYKDAREVRSDWNFYKKIAGFTKSQNILITDVWKRAGISFSAQGRPANKNL